MLRREGLALRRETAALCREARALCGEPRALRGETPSLRGEEPALRGETPALRGETPALRRETSARCAKTLLAVLKTRSRRDSVPCVRWSENKPRLCACPISGARGSGSVRIIGDVHTGTGVWRRGGGMGRGEEATKRRSDGGGERRREGETERRSGGEERARQRDEVKNRARAPAGGPAATKRTTRHPADTPSICVTMCVWRSGEGLSRGGGRSG